MRTRDPTTLAWGPLAVHIFCSILFYNIWKFMLIRVELLGLIEMLDLTVDLSQRTRLDLEYFLFQYKTL